MGSQFFAGEIATELVKQLLKLGKKALFVKSRATQFQKTINEFLPIIQEIKISGVELPQVRQRQLDELSQKLREGLEMAQRASTLARWNVYKNLQFAKKMEKLEKLIVRFIQNQFPAHIMADVHHLRVHSDTSFRRIEDHVLNLRFESDMSFRRIEERLSAVRIENRFMEEDVKRMDEENCGEWGFPVEFQADFLVMGVCLRLTKEKLKHDLFGEEFRVIGLCGMGGSGKTTLAKEISRDPDVKRHFNEIIFETISQSPNVEYLRRKLWLRIMGNRMFDGNGAVTQWRHSFQQVVKGQVLVILDDVWSLPVLEQLIYNTPGCKTLVVSRLKFPTVFKSTHELELLREEEALSLFCYYAFEQHSIPPDGDKKLVKQVVAEGKGLPLAIKVIGASLRGQPPKCWASAKNKLSRGEPIDVSHEIKLLERMEISIKTLGEKSRECFLDLGSFPEDKRIPLDVLINMWVEIHDLDEENAFEILMELSNRNLVTLTKDTQDRAGDIHSSYSELSVTQHDVLRDLSLHMNNHESVNRRKRLIMPRRENGLPKDWERNRDQPFEAQIVSIHTGEMKESDWFDMNFPKTEVLILIFSSGGYFLPPFLERMPKLKALVMINYGSTGATLQNLTAFASLVHLQSLWLEKIVVPSLTKHMFPLKNLQKISLVLCEVSECFNGSELDLSLIFPSLEDLIIDHCIDLIDLPLSIFRVCSLKSLNISNCHDLFELPEQLGNLNSLQTLRVYACPSLKDLPKTICALQRLKYLNISECVNLRNLPEELGELRNLEKIDMRGCSQITSLPRSVELLRSLEHVICDEEIAHLWEEAEKSIPGLRVQVVEECYTLDWLTE